MELYEKRNFTAHDCFVANTGRFVFQSGIRFLQRIKSRYPHSILVF